MCGTVHSHVMCWHATCNCGVHLSGLKLHYCNTEYLQQDEKEVVLEYW